MKTKAPEHWKYESAGPIRHGWPSRWNVFEGNGYVQRWRNTKDPRRVLSLITALRGDELVGHWRLEINGGVEPGFDMTPRRFSKQAEEVFSKHSQRLHADEPDDDPNERARRIEQAIYDTCVELSEKVTLDDFPVEMRQWWF